MLELWINLSRASLNSKASNHLSFQKITRCSLHLLFRCNSSSRRRVQCRRLVECSRMPPLKAWLQSIYRTPPSPLNIHNSIRHTLWMKLARIVETQIFNSRSLSHNSTHSSNSTCNNSNSSNSNLNNNSFSLVPALKVWSQSTAIIPVNSKWPSRRLSSVQLGHSSSSSSSVHVW